MKEILEIIIKHLVENKDEVEITEIPNSENDKIVTMQVKVAKDDMGRIIGKQGRIASSIRTVMKSVGAKERKKVTVEFIDEK